MNIIHACFWIKHEKITSWNHSFHSLSSCSFHNFITSILQLSFWKRLYFIERQETSLYASYARIIVPLGKMQREHAVSEGITMGNCSVKTTQSCLQLTLIPLKKSHCITFFPVLLFCHWVVSGVTWNANAVRTGRYHRPIYPISHMPKAIHQVKLWNWQGQSLQI